MNNQDDLYKEALTEVPDFVFDENVASVFSDMINRSVPGYATITAVSGVLAARFTQPNTNLYDLGCSLGATSFAIASSAANGCECIAVDNSPAMIDRLTELLAARDSNLPVMNATIRPLLEDVESVAITNASLVTMNFTLQFLQKSHRLAMLEKIYQGLNPDGVLVLSEKIKLADDRVDHLFIDLHHDFKRNNGYSDLEISQKRDSIENVLIPETIEAHKQRLKAAGFSRIEVWFQCFNFISLVAFK